MRILICDDDQRFCADVQSVIEEWKTEKSIESVFVDVYNSSEDLLEDIRNKPPYIVNLMYVQKIEKVAITLTDGTYGQISADQYITELERRFVFNVLENR